MRFSFFGQHILCIKLPWNTQVGPDLRLFHGMGLVANNQAVIGRDAVCLHTTTICAEESLSVGTQAAPIIWDAVDIGAHVISGVFTVGSALRELAKIAGLEAKSEPYTSLSMLDLGGQK